MKFLFEDEKEKRKFIEKYHADNRCPDLAIRFKFGLGHEFIVNSLDDCVNNNDLEKCKECWENYVGFVVANKNMEEV